MIDDVGIEGFVRRLPELSDAVLWDTRVWMAHAGTWPPEDDRFAADLGWTDQVKDPSLRRLAGAVAESRFRSCAAGTASLLGPSWRCSRFCSYQPFR